MKKNTFGIPAGIIILLVILGIISVLGIYKLKFDGNLSEDPAVWGHFGDYVGGILNPFLCLINIGVLIYLTYLVASKDDERSFNELKYRALKEFTDKIYALNLFDKTKNGWTESQLDIPFELINYLEKFKTFHNYFFREPNEFNLYDSKAKDLILSLENLISIRNENMKNLNTELKDLNSEQHKTRLQEYKNGLYIMPTISEWRGSKSRIESQEFEIIKLMQAIYLNLDLKPFHTTISSTLS